MRVPLIAYLKAYINKSKCLEKSGKASIGVVHNDYFSFSKAYYCFIPKSIVIVTIII